MRNIFRLFPILLTLPLLSCTKGGDESTLLFECEQQNQGAACLTLSQRREGEEAMRYLRMGCEKGSTAACIRVSELTQDRAEALRALQQACEWKNPEACEKAKAAEGAK